MQSEEQELCIVSEEVYTSVVLRYALVFNVICATVAIPLDFLVIKATFSHNLVHYNIKWILIFHLGCLITHDFFRIINHVWDVSLFLSLPASNCNVFTTARCLSLRIPINLTMYLVFSGTFMLSIERCIATWKLDTYGKNKILGPVLVSVQVICAIGFMYVVCMELDHQAVLAYCLITSLTPPALVIGSITFLVILQVTAVIIFEVLMKINRAKKENLLHSRSAQFSDGVMSKMYQVRENLRTMKTLMLFFLLSCVNSFCYNLLRGFVHLNKYKFARPLFYALIESVLVLGVLVHSIHSGMGLLRRNCCRRGRVVCAADSAGIQHYTTGGAHNSSPCNIIVCSGLLPELMEFSIHLPQFSLILPAALWYSYRRVSRKAAAKHLEKLDRPAPENTQLHFNIIAESWK